MDPDLATTHKKLRALRERQDLTLKRSPLIRPTYIDEMTGEEKEFTLRYYQVQMIFHLLAMRNFVCGDDTGLGKCQPYDSLVLTDQGLLQMGEIEDWSEMEPDSFRPMSRPVHVLVDGEHLPIKSFYYGGVKPTVTATTRYGFKNTGSQVHPMLVLRGGKHQWVKARDLNEGDHLCVERREMSFPEVEPKLVQGPGAVAERMTPDLARFLGYYIGEGSLNSKDQVKVSQCPVANPEPHADINRLFKLVFGREPNRPHIADLYLSDRKARRWLVANGLNYCHSPERTVPACILQATRGSSREFLMALFEGEGHVSKSLIEFSTASEELGRQLQVMLLRFGVVSNRSIKKVKAYPDNTYWRLTICGQDAQQFRDHVGFISSRKVEALEALLDRPRNTNHDVVPEVQWLFDQVRAALLEATSRSGANKNRTGSGIKQFGVSVVNTLNNIRNYGRNPSYAFIEKVVDLLEQAAPSAESLASLKDFLETRYFYDPVVSLEEGEEEVFDIEVDDPRHCFVGNGLVNHNTIESISSLCYLWGMPAHKDRKTIILAKKAAVVQWAKAFNTFTTGVHVIVSKGSPGQRAKAYKEFMVAKGPTVLISGYRSMVRDVKQVQDWENFVFITDEATVYKNPGTQIHQLCKHMASRANRIWALTATLIKNNLMEGFGIMQVVVPGLFQHTQTSFMNDYCIVRMQRVRGNRQVPVLVGYRPKDIERFKAKIDAYYLGRPKHEVADELPILTMRNIEVGMTSFQKDLYQAALEGLIEKGDGEEKETDKLTALIYCQQIVNHPALLEYKDADSEKMDALVDMLTEGGEFEGQKVIVYTRFRKLVDFAIPYLKKKGVECVRVTGKENEDQRQEAMDIFQDMNSGTDVIWITDAGGDSINLQAAKALFFFDTPWSAGDYLQCLDTETEILTPEGFKHRGEIQVGDMVAAFDPPTSKITWSPVKSVIDRPLKEGEEMFALRSRHMDVRVTGGHRMLFQRKTYTNKKSVWPSGWRFETAAEMAAERSHFRVPASGVQQAPGLPLTSAQLEFIGWYMSDGYINTSNAQLAISQATHQPQIEDLRRCIQECGFNWSEYSRDPNKCGGFENGKPQIVFSIPKGTEGGTRARNGWVALAGYLDKGLSPLLEELTADQLGHLLRGLHLGDGSKYRGGDWIQRSYHVYTSNRVFADRLQSLCIRRGYRCNLAVRSADPSENRKEGYTLHIKREESWALCGWAKDGQRPKFASSPTKTGERVWCVENGVGTLVTRRRGKVVIVGNCIGRMIRIGSIHDRVYALHLIVKGSIDSRVQEVKNKKLKLIEAILGQRIRGEKEAPTIYEVESATKELYEYLVEDARGNR